MEADHISGPQMHFYPLQYHLGTCISDCFCSMTLLPLCLHAHSILKADYHCHAYTFLMIAACGCGTTSTCKFMQWHSDYVEVLSVLTT